MIEGYRQYYILYRINELRGELRYYLKEMLGDYSESINTDTVIQDVIRQHLFGRESAEQYSWYLEIIDALIEKRSMEQLAPVIAEELGAITMRYIGPTIDTFAGRAFVKYWFDGPQLIFNVVEQHGLPSTSHPVTTQHAGSG